MKIKVPIEISARHIHLTKEDFKKIFGKEELTVLKKLKHNQFAAKENVDLRRKDRVIKNIRIVGPFRDKTIVELSLTDFIYLKLKPFFYVGLKNEKIKNVGDFEIIGPKGKLKLNKGAVVHLRHIHIDPERAKRYNLKNGQKVSVEVKGKRGAILKNVYVRVDEDFDFSLHLDTDEGNSVGIIKNGFGYILR
ncbi:MAG: PduL/EutD family phosphate acyltransferase [Minisyncoccia bacterium]